MNYEGAGPTIRLPWLFISHSYPEIEILFDWDSSPS
jgi:hypothetical protein